MFHMPCLFFTDFDDQYWRFPVPISDQMKRYFRTPEIAFDVITRYQDFVKARANEDYGYSKIIDFCKEHINPGNSVRWMGKFTDLLSEDSDFAEEQRKIYNGTLGHVHLNDLLAFRTFLNDINYLHKIKVEYEIGLEYRGEIESMSSEPDCCFPTAEESLGSLHEFINEKRNLRNVMNFAINSFPYITFDFTDDSL